MFPEQASDAGRFCSGQARAARRTEPSDRICLYTPPGRQCRIDQLEYENRLRAAIEQTIWPCIFSRSSIYEQAMWVAPKRCALADELLAPCRLISLQTAEAAGQSITHDLGDHERHPELSRVPKIDPAFTVSIHISPSDLREVVCLFTSTARCAPGRQRTQ